MFLQCSAGALVEKRASWAGQLHSSIMESDIHHVEMTFLHTRRSLRDQAMYCAHKEREENGENGSDMKSR